MGAPHHQGITVTILRAGTGTGEGVTETGGREDPHPADTEAGTIAHLMEGAPLLIGMIALLVGGIHQEPTGIDIHLLISCLPVPEEAGIHLFRDPGRGLDEAESETGVGEVLLTDCPGRPGACHSQLIPVSVVLYCGLSPSFRFDVMLLKHCSCAEGIDGFFHFSPRPEHSSPRGSRSHRHDEPRRGHRSCSLLHDQDRDRKRGRDRDRSMGRTRGKNARSVLERCVNLEHFKLKLHFLEILSFFWGGALCYIRNSSRDDSGISSKKPRLDTGDLGSSIGSADTDQTQGNLGGPCTDSTEPTPCTQDQWPEEDFIPETQVEEDKKEQELPPPPAWVRCSPADLYHTREQVCII